VAKKRQENPTVLTNQFKLVTSGHGDFDLEMIGAITDDSGVATLPTGQAVSTGKRQGEEIDFSLMAGDIEQCTRMQLWRIQVQNNVPGYIDSATLIFFNDQGKPALETAITEIFPRSFGVPQGSTDGDGDAAKRTGRFRIWETTTIHT